MFVDTHCHLTFSDFDEDRAMVIGNAKKAGVKKFIVPGTNLHVSDYAARLAEEKPEIFPTVGCHPYDTVSYPSRAEIVRHISGRTVAIGECGLDYHAYGSEPARGKKQEQAMLFEIQLRIAVERDLPVIIHCREAFADMFSILDSLPSIPRGVLHCFAGGLEDARMAEERGLLVGFDGNATYSKQLARIIPHIPLPMILLETESPYLPPEGHRGERSEPKYIPRIAARIAELQNVDTGAVEAETTRNALSLFRI